MTNADDLRSEVAAQLGALSGVDQPLHTSAEASTANRYANDVRRADVRKLIVGRYLDRDTPGREGRSAIITAGAPGSGKTSMLGELFPALGSYRILDADVVKDYLIERALEDGIYDDLLTYRLADGHTISPRELAALVHNESVQLIDLIRRICVARRENIVVEATLSWEHHGPRLFGELASAGYASLDVLGVDVAPSVAHEQALSRWWSGRAEWTSGAEPLGKRFVPPDAIDMCYDDTKLSRCARHALNMADIAKSGEIASVQVRIFGRSTDGQLEEVISRAYPGDN